MFVSGRWLTLAPSKIHFDHPPLPWSFSSPAGGGYKTPVGNQLSKVWSYRLPNFEAIRGVTLEIMGVATPWWNGDIPLSSLHNLKKNFFRLF